MTGATTSALHPVPALERVAVQQLRLIGYSRRWFYLVLGGIGLVALMGEPWVHIPRYLPRLMFGSFALLASGVFWAALLWSNESPSRRDYHWSLPVDRAAHDLARIAVGAGQLLAATLIIALAGWLIALVDGNAGELARFSGMAWANLFVGPLITYFLMSVLMIRSDHPARWVIGVLISVPVTVMLTDRIELQRLRDALEAFFTGRYGLLNALAGQWVQEIDTFQRVRQGVDTGRQSMPAWPPAALVWLPVSAALVTAAARYRPGALGRWLGQRR